jgi:hypothetical protein
VDNPRSLSLRRATVVGMNDETIELPEDPRQLPTAEVTVPLEGTEWWLKL